MAGINWCVGTYRGGCRQWRRWTGWRRWCRKRRWVGRRALWGLFNSTWGREGPRPPSEAWCQSQVHEPEILVGQKVREVILRHLGRGRSHQKTGLRNQPCRKKRTCVTLRYNIIHVERLPGEPTILTHEYHGGSSDCFYSCVVRVRACLQYRETKKRLTEQIWMILLLQRAKYASAVGTRFGVQSYETEDPSQSEGSAEPHCALTRVSWETAEGSRRRSGPHTGSTDTFFSPRSLNTIIKNCAAHDCVSVVYTVDYTVPSFSFCWDAYVISEL